MPGIVNLVKRLWLERSLFLHVRTEDWWFMCIFLDLCCSSTVAREVSFYSLQQLRWRQLVRILISDYGVVNPKWDAYINPTKTQITLWKMGQKECKSQRVGRTSLKCCFQDMSWSLHSWTHSWWSHHSKLKDWLERLAQQSRVGVPLAVDSSSVSSSHTRQLTASSTRKSNILFLPPCGWTSQTFTQPVAKLTVCLETIYNYMLSLLTSCLLGLFRVNQFIRKALQSILLYFGLPM